MFTTKSKKRQLEQYDDKYLFSLYISDFHVGDVIRSPLRDDDNIPSFSTHYYNGRIMFKDFKTNQSGNIIQLVMYLFNLNFFQAVDKIISDAYKNKPDFTKSKTIYKNENIQLNNGDTKRFIPLFRKPEEEDKLFWKSYCELNSLDKFNIYCVSGYFYNTYKVNFNKYVFKIGSRYKFYNPGNTPKYFGNTNSNSIQGWHMLNFDKKDLILVSSMKEVIVLYELGIQAIAPNAESVLISPKVLKFLKFNFNIKIWYDWDIAGLTNAKKHSKIYNLKIDKRQFLFPKEVKDVSDFRKKYGFNITKEYLK
jgi:hypothetical protein